MYSIGIDIGSSAIKSSVLDNRDNINFLHSSFHYGNVKSELIMHFQKIADKTYGRDAFFFSNNMAKGKGSTTMQ